MTEFGVQPTGYVRKPLSVFLAELEAAMITEFGPGVIQTSQSPLGQLNGLMADLLSEIDERMLEVYQSYDPDQAEGSRLDTLARVRLVQRQANAPDFAFRQTITNAGQARIDIQDMIGALNGIPGVTYARIFTPDAEIPEVGPGTIAVAVIGGDDEMIAQTLRQFIAPGIDTYGNVRVSTFEDGFCRDVSIIRPVPLKVQLRVTVRRSADQMNCPPPSTLVIKEILEAGWLSTRINGMFPTNYRVRSIIERELENVEVVSVVASIDPEEFSPIYDYNVSFLEMVEIEAEVTEV